MRAGRTNLGLPLRLSLFVLLVGGLVAPQASSFMAARADNPRTTPKARPFVVRGEVKGLYPGLKKPLILKVKNRARYAVKVKTIEIRPKATRVRKCPSRFLKVKKIIRPKLRLRPRGRGKAKVRVQLKRMAPDACKKVRFPLAYSGKAVRR